MNELEIASYLDRGMATADRERVEDHMVDCAECRENVAEAEQLIRKLGRPRYLARFAGLAAIAAAALVVLVLQPTRQTQPLDRVTRDAPAAAPLAAYEPAETVPQQPPRFVWAAARGATTYRISITEADGTTVWSTTVSDTTAALPASVILQPHVKYVWFVDATLPDGSAQSTGLRELIVADTRK
jgi:hypothetical protein